MHSKRVDIVTVAYGWVLVGVITDDGRESGELELAYAHTIACWGTTSGLAQLCHEGPRRETRLNKSVPFGDVLRINRQHVGMRLACDPAKWSKALGIE